MLRRHMYRAARFLGDVRAVGRNRVPQRLVGRMVFRGAFKLGAAVLRLLLKLLHLS